MKRGRAHFTKPVSGVPVKFVDVPICVLPRPTDVELVQAGLGKRAVAIPEDGTHAGVLILS